MSSSLALFPYQQPAAESLLRSLRTHRIALDASDTGTGKMYTGSYVAAQLARPVGVICPKVIIPVWHRVLSGFGVTPLFVTNYERLRLGKTGFGEWNFKDFVWTIPKDTLLIFDEAQRCQGDKSQNARCMKAAKPYTVLAASATLAENPMQMRAIGYLLGMHEWRDWFRWCIRSGCWRAPFGGLQFKKADAAKNLLKIHAEIFPEKGVRIRKSDLGDAFPDNLISAEAYDMNDGGEIQAAYEEMVKELEKLIASSVDGAGETTTLGLEQKMRQRVEIAKVPGLVGMADDLVAEGNHVVIFTNYRAALEQLCVKMGTTCAVYGGQDEDERQKCIDDFQSDKEPVIVVNIQAGGTGLSLHDLNGNFPRVSLICPTYNAKDLAQVLGRIHRAGAKSKAVQMIVFAAGTPEEKACDRVQHKLNNITLINDGDLSLVDDLLGAKTRKGNRSNKKFEKSGRDNLETDVIILSQVASTSPRMDSTLTNAGQELVSTESRSLGAAGENPAPGSLSKSRGGAARSARLAHNQQAAGSNPAPATTPKDEADILKCLKNIHSQQQVSVSCIINWMRCGFQRGSFILSTLVRRGFVTELGGMDLTKIASAIAEPISSVVQLENTGTQVIHVKGSYSDLGVGGSGSTPDAGKTLTPMPKRNASQKGSPDVLGGCESPSGQSATESLPGSTVPVETPAFRAEVHDAKPSPADGGETLQQQPSMPPLAGDGVVVPITPPPVQTGAAATLAYSERPHASMSPSKLKSLAICAGFENDPDSDKTAADRGSFGHECVEHETPERCTLDPKLKAAVETCIKYKHYVIGLAGKGARVEAETKLHYFDQYGYTDLVVMNAERTLAHCIDWKFAFHFYAADGPQFWAYVVGLFDAYPSLQTVTVHVPHPFRNEIDVETFTRAKDYQRLYGQLAAIIARAKAKRPEDYNISVQCGYCGAAGRCVKLAKVGMEIAARYVPDEPALPSGTLHGTEIVDPADFAVLLRIKPAITKAMAGWGKAALAMHLSGTEIPGYELGEKDGKRVIENTTGVFNIVKERIPLDQFLNATKVSVPELMDMWAATYEKGKGKSKEMLEAMLIDGDLLTTSGNSSVYLKAVRK